MKLIRSLKYKLKKIFFVLPIIIIVFSLVCLPVSAADSSPSLDVFKVTSGVNRPGSSIPFSFSGNSLSFDRSGSAVFWVLFNFVGINSSDLLNGSFSFSVTFNGLLPVSSTYFGLYAFNGVSYDSIGSVILLGNRADFLIESGTLLSDYDHFAFRCGISSAPDNICSFSFSDLFVNFSSNSFNDFLSDVSFFFSSILSFIVSILSFIINSPLLYFFAFIIIIFILYLFYRVKRHE